MPAPSETLQHPTGLHVAVPPERTPQSFFGKLGSIFKEPPPIGTSEWISNKETRKHAAEIRSMLENALIKSGVVVGNEILVGAVNRETGEIHIVRGTASDDEDWPVESNQSISIESVNFRWEKELFDGKSFRLKTVFLPDSYTVQPYQVFTVQGGEEQQALHSSPNYVIGHWLTKLRESNIAELDQKFASEFIDHYVEMNDKERRNMELAQPYIEMGYFDPVLSVNQNM